MKVYTTVPSLLKHSILAPYAILTHCLRLSFLCLFTFSCQTKDSQKTDLEERLAKLEKENKELRDNLNQQNQSNVTEVVKEPYNQPESYKYAFVVLTIAQTHQKWSESLNTFIDVEKEYYSCSSINKFPFFSDEIKYQFMDDVQRKNILLPRERINDRQCLFFDNYEEASKKREAYLISR